MADEERRSAKRSRFDQIEPEPKRRDIRRSRSPVDQRTAFSPGSEGKKTPLDPAAAAGKPKINPLLESLVSNTFCSGRSGSNQCPNTGEERHSTC